MYSTPKDASNHSSRTAAYLRTDGSCRSLVAEEHSGPLTAVSDIMMTAYWCWMDATSIRNHKIMFPPSCRCVRKVMSCHAMSFLQHVLPFMTPPFTSPRNAPARTITNQPLPAVFSLSLGLQRRHSTCSYLSSVTFRPSLTFFSRSVTCWPAFLSSNTYL